MSFRAACKFSIWGIRAVDIPMNRRDSVFGLLVHRNWRWPGIYKAWLIFLELFKQCIRVFYGASASKISLKLNILLGSIKQPSHVCNILDLLKGDMTHWITFSSQIQAL